METASCVTGLTREDVAIQMKRLTLSQRTRYLDAHIADCDVMELQCRLRKREARARDLEWQKALARTLGILVCISALIGMSGCASTNTVLRVGIGYDITDKINGCERGIYGCGHPGTRETATLELLWAPSIKPGPYAGYSHKSHYSTGFPFNRKLDADFSDEVQAGQFFQIGSRQ